MRDEAAVVTPLTTLCNTAGWSHQYIVFSAANPLIGEVVQSRRRPLLGPSPG